MRKQRQLIDEYRFPGFRPRAKVRGIFGDPKARIIRLERSQKKLSAAVVERCIGVITTKHPERYETYPAEMPEFIWKWMCGGCPVESAGA